MAKKNEKSNLSLNEKSKILHQKAMRTLSEMAGVSKAEVFEKYENLIEELNVHQIELEHQNEALTLSQQNLTLANDRFLDLFENAPIGYFLLNSDYTILQVNKTMAELFDKKTAWFIGKKFNSLIHSDYQNEIHFHYQAFKKQHNTQKSDVIIKHPNGVDFFARIISNLSYNSSREVVYRTAVMDISYEKEIERKLIDEKNRANFNEKIKGEFLANMSHEIRTPLNGVIGFVDLLNQTSLDYVQMEYAKNAMISARSLLRVINDILDFSKIEAGKMDISFEKVNLQSLIYEVADIVKHETSLKGLELIVDIPNDAPSHIYIDPARLRQILMNIIGNAVKFTDDGEVELKLICEVENDNPVKHRIIFEIRDTGIGISNEQLTTLFKAFSQADMATTRKFGGTGLGLVISAALARMMNGKIDLTSQKGIGSVFSVIFENVHVDYIKNNPISFDLENVLLIDAHPNHAQVVERYLNENTSSFTILSDIESQRYDEAIKLANLIVINHCKHHIDALKVVKYLHFCCQDELENKRILVLCNAIEFATLTSKLIDYPKVLFMIKPVSQQKLVNSIFGETSALPTTQFAEEELIKSNEFEKSILIVEDVEMNILLVSRIISKHFPNVQIIEAKNGQEALERMLDIYPDLILMDIQMPIMDGYEATRIIRNKYNHKGNVPIVALTAHAMMSEEKKCFEAGMDAFITKPVTSDKLIEVVRYFLSV